MKDMFGREMSVGDVVVYATRSGSNQHMMVAKVLRTTDANTRVVVIAGNDWEWKRGQSVYDEETGFFKITTLEAYEATLSVSNNVMIANGIDADGIHALLIESQKKAIASRTV